MERIEEFLREFGLTEYEIKAFVTLLKLDTATAEQISDIGNIPLPRVYDTLVELKKKGFVLISKTRPKKFKSMPPEKALQNLIMLKKEDFNKGIKHLEENVKNIKSVVPETKRIEFDKTEEFWSTEKRENLQTIFSEEEKAAKSEILIFSGDMSWLPERMELIKGALRRGVKIKIITREFESSGIERIINKLKPKLEVKKGYNGSVRGEIIDNNIALIAFKNKNEQESQSRISKYELTIFKNSVMLEIFKENFEFWWNKL